MAINDRMAAKGQGTAPRGPAVRPAEIQGPGHGC